MSSIFKNKKVMFAVICFLLLGLAPLMFKGLQYGMDFSGGTLIQVNLDVTGEETVDSQTLITVLENRLNSYGLKDVSIRPWGNPVSYIVVEIAETDPESINQLQALIGQQGRFETLFEGKVILSGTDIVSVITDPQEGYGMRVSGSGVEWSVPFLISAEGAENMAKAIEGKCSTPMAENCPETLYMFIDRPENAVIVMPNELANKEQEIPQSLQSESVSSKMVSLEDIVKNSDAELIITNEITSDVLKKTAGKTVIIPEDYFDEDEFTTASRVYARSQTGEYWIVNALNLNNIIHLTPGVTTGKPITRPLITGHASTLEEGKMEIDRVVILLKSGKLPVSVSVGSVSTISPSLGEEFLKYSIYAAILAMFIVASCLFVRYRKPKIAIPMMITLVFEITMILGIAALIGWQMDLASMAGIIVAIGTGIDDQIIIIDEVLRKEKDKDREISIVARIRKAFSIVFMSAGTLAFAMSPLLFMGLGVLKGFAITTIIGIIVGIFITRPAYAEIVNKLM